MEDANLTGVSTLTAPAPAPAAPTPSVIRNPDFVRLWTAETISQFGTQISLLALPLVAVSLLQASPFEVAMLGTIEFLPFILFSLPAGAWVDRLRRRLEAIPHEQHRVVDGVEYVEWSAVVSAMSHDEVSESAPAPAAGEEGPAPTATSG